MIIVTRSSTESVRDTQLDTLRIPALADLQQKLLDEAADHGFNPYEYDGSQTVIRERTRRRTLDDMRRLSETIKRARAQRTEQDVPKGEYATSMPPSGAL
jgi:hypothetical protein